MNPINKTIEVFLFLLIKIIYYNIYFKLWATVVLKVLRNRIKKM